MARNTNALKCVYERCICPFVSQASRNIQGRLLERAIQKVRRRGRGTAISAVARLVLRYVHCSYDDPSRLTRTLLQTTTKIPHPQTIGNLTSRTTLLRIQFLVTTRRRARPGERESTQFRLRTFSFCFPSNVSRNDFVPVIKRFSFAANHVNRTKEETARFPSSWPVSAAWSSSPSNRRRTSCRGRCT